MLHHLKKSTSKYLLAIDARTWFKYSSMNKQLGGYVPVYKFPHIRILSVINRLKLYQTFLTATCLPGATLLKLVEVINWDIFQATATFGVTGCCLLYPIGYFTNNFVGFIYFNEETSTTRIAYIDFWGRRKDREIPSNDLVPVHDSPSTPFDNFYHTLKRISTKETWKLNLHHGIILDSDRIKHIL